MSAHARPHEQIDEIRCASNLLVPTKDAGSLLAPSPARPPKPLLTARMWDRQHAWTPAKLGSAAMRSRSPGRQLTTIRSAVPGAPKSPQNMSPATHMGSIVRFTLHAPCSAPCSMPPCRPPSRSASRAHSAAVIRCGPAARPAGADNLEKTAVVNNNAAPVLCEC